MLSPRKEQGGETTANPGKVWPEESGVVEAEGHKASLCDTGGTHTPVPCHPAPDCLVLLQVHNHLHEPKS